MMKPQADIEVQWHEIIRDKLACNTVLVGRSNGAWLMELAVELKNLKEDLSNKPLGTEFFNIFTFCIMAFLF